MEGGELKKQKRKWFFFLLVSIITLSIFWYFFPEVIKPAFLFATDTTIIDENEAKPSPIPDLSSVVENLAQASEPKVLHETEELEDNLGIQSGLEDKRALFPLEEMENLRNPFQKVIDLVTEEESLDAEKNLIQYGNFENEVELDQQDVTYQDLINQVTESETIVEEKVEIIEPQLKYPPFILKGLVSNGEKRKAIILYGVQSHIVSVAERIEEWLIEEISNDQVFVRNDIDQRFILTLEGVVFDNEEI